MAQEAATGARALGLRELLGSIELFGPLSRDDLDELVSIAARRKLEPREILFRQGSKGDQVYGVLSGQLRALTTGPDGRDVIFAYHDPGDVVGEIAVLDREERSATVEAVGATELLVLHRRDLMPFLERHPKAAVELAKILARRLRRLSASVEDALFLTLPTRLAKKLLSLAKDYGEQTPEGLVIRQHLPQHTLGELVATSRESINKQLRQWQRDGLVGFDRGVVTLVDRARLEEIAEFWTP